MQKTSVKQKSAKLRSDQKKFKRKLASKAKLKARRLLTY